MTDNYSGACISSHHTPRAACLTVVRHLLFEPEGVRLNQGLFLHTANQDRSGNPRLQPGTQEMTNRGLRRKPAALPNYC